MNDHLITLEKRNNIYISEDRDLWNKEWLNYQKREREFWRHKITETDYNPDPVSNFLPFIRHWGIEQDYFCNKSVLEIGSGPFGFFSALARMGTEFLPDDLVIADSLMEFYQQFELSGMMPENAIKLQARGEEIPLPDNSFDIILTTNTLDHVNNYNGFMSEIRRLLKPDGVLLFSVHVVSDMFKWCRPLLKIIDRNHPHHFMERCLQNILIENKFESKRQITVPMYKENPIPNEYNTIQKLMYFIGFRMMSCNYGVARVIK